MENMAPFVVLLLDSFLKSHAFDLFYNFFIAYNLF